MSIIFFVSDPCSELGRYEHMFTQMLKSHNETYSMVDIRKGRAYVPSGISVAYMNKIPLKLSIP